MNLADHNHCSGCGACYAICPHHAITMCPDAEVFFYPSVNDQLCVSCGLCEKTCPAVNLGPSREPKVVYAAKAKDDELRQASSSGGIFSLLAREIISTGGIVYGAAIRSSDLMVCHCSAETEDELAWLRGSKYVQSEMGDVYAQTKNSLEAGRLVLFSGTPCQVAGVRRFLGKDYDNLYCVEVICHAAPSPLAWKKYLEKRATEAAGDGHLCLRPDTVIDRKISSRHKKCGWKRYSMSLRFHNDMEYLSDLTTDTYLRGFLAELYNRPSCHNCSVRELRSGADITLGDYWNVHQRFPLMDDDMGTSVVLVNSDKGNALIEKIADLCNWAESDYADIRRTNPAVYRSSPPNSKRGKFFKLIRGGADFDQTVVRLLKRPLWKRFGSAVKQTLIRLSGK